MKTVEIKFNDDGSIEIESKGFRDNKCLDAMKDMEKLFGAADECKLKPEAHKVALNERKRL